MKKPPEPLIRDLLETSDLAQLRSCSLERMLVTARSRRRRRQVACLCLGVALPALLVSWLLLPRWAPGPDRLSASVEPAQPRPARPEPVPPQIQLISTEELLALFPDRPRALIGPPGSQRLVFLDEPLAGGPGER